MFFELAPHAHSTLGTGYSIEQAKDLDDLKAFSQNLMHSNLSIIDGVYGILSEDNVRDRIVALSSDKDEVNQLKNDQLKALQEEAAARL